MDISVARTFLEVVKTGSFVGAANNLNLTQTAVSARIRVLEEQLDRPVFIRNKAGARLTPAGEQFLRFATTLVQVWARAQRAVALPPGRETVVTVGAELSLWNPLLRHWLLWMRRECPEIAVSTQIDVSERLMEQVQDGTLDVAVLYAAPSRPGIIAELLFEEKLVLVRTTPTNAPSPPRTMCRSTGATSLPPAIRRPFPISPIRWFRSAMARWRWTIFWRRAAAAISARALSAPIWRKAGWRWCRAARSFPIQPIWSIPPRPIPA
jgi:DNA-binding transcriptional LysR family regulator